MDRWTIVWSLLRVAIFFVLFIGLYLLLFQVIAATGIDFRFLGSMADTVQELIVLVMALLLICVCSGRFDTKLLADLGLKNERMPANLLAGFVLGAILVVAIIGGIFALGGYRVQSVALDPGVFSYLIFFLVVAVLEEVVFRGFIFSTLEKGIGTTGGVIVASLIFGFAHMINPANGLPFFDKAFSCLVLSFESGLPLNLAFLVSRNLWLPIGIHWAWNFFEGPVFGAYVSGHDLGTALVHSRLEPGFLLGGGLFGPESSLSGLVFGVLLACLIARFKDLAPALGLRDREQDQDQRSQ
ncbi:MAG: CPBP family intramembrane metalloprotease [Cyanobacteria bacterium HKST-UBA02]|nr:CPBP family intramembrane metalloprotease [Cyanobacteria bacterium HKST-UBA02]